MKRRYYRRKKSSVFGKSLKKWRGNAGLTLKEAAFRLGIKCKGAESYLCMIEKGQRCMPENILMNVPNVYGVLKEQVFDAAYHPQKTFLSTVNRTSVLPKPFYDYLTQLDKRDQQDLVLFAEFLASRKQIRK
jgi:transcriptional regulator with XRE-family HTH domain